MTPKDKKILAAQDFLASRKNAYTQVFGNPDDVAVKAVMQDLREFCRVSTTTFHPDARVHAALEGRREVVLRILDHVDLPLHELVAKYTQGS